MLINGMNNATRSRFPQRRENIRAVLANQENANGLFVHPVPVTISGSLFWDGEHRFPNNVGLKNYVRRKPGRFIRSNN
jgi:hypothetical protein